MLKFTNSHSNIQNIILSSLTSLQTILEFCRTTCPAHPFLILASLSLACQDVRLSSLRFPSISFGSNPKQPPVMCTLAPKTKEQVEGG